MSKNQAQAENITKLEQTTPERPGLAAARAMLMRVSGEGEMSREDSADGEMVKAAARLYYCALNPNITEVPTVLKCCATIVEGWIVFGTERGAGEDQDKIWAEADSFSRMIPQIVAEVAAVED